MCVCVCAHACVGEYLRMVSIVCDFVRAWVRVLVRACVCVRARARARASAHELALQGSMQTAGGTPDIDPPNVCTWV